jgi:GNAT superfamily N-acetyltransferase
MMPEPSVRFFFMRGILTRKPGPDKPLNLLHYDTDDERGSTLVSVTLGAEIAARFGSRSESPLSILAYDGDALVGELNGDTHWGWCYIRHFWVEESWRRRGVERRLLAHVEMEARGRQCVGLYLDTFDPGAAQFYEHCGFLRFGQIDDFPPGHTRAFLYKKLPSS